MKRAKLLFLALAAAGLAVLGNGWLAARFVALEPGWARPAAALVRVEGGKSAGNLLYVVVRSRPATLIDLVRSAFDPLVEVRPRPEGALHLAGWREYDQAMRERMRESRAVAAAVALRSLDDRTGPWAPGQESAQGAPIAVDFAENGVAGGSAGLMIALEIYAQLVPAAFPAGRLIAGTGELLADGTVLAVDGVAQKIAASIAAGADVFLIPRANLDEALWAEGKIKLIPVDTFEQAVAAVRRLRGED